MQASDSPLQRYGRMQQTTSITQAAADATSTHTDDSSGAAPADYALHLSPQPGDDEVTLKAALL